LPPQTVFVSYGYDKNSVEIKPTSLIVVSLLGKTLKGVLNPNFRPVSFELKKYRFFEINFDLGFRVL